MFKVLSLLGEVDTEANNHREASTHAYHHSPTTIKSSIFCALCWLEQVMPQLKVGLLDRVITAPSNKSTSSAQPKLQMQ